MVWIARKGQRIQAQRIDGWFVQQPQIGLHRAQLRQVERDQVVPQDECSAVGQAIQGVERMGQLARWKGDRGASIAAYACQLVDATAVAADFQIDGYEK